jgi:hypothetical protein
MADLLATAGWGWHSETALHLLRLIVTGVFDRFPALQVIIGGYTTFPPLQCALSVVGAERLLRL